MDSELDSRSLHLLKDLVERYIKDGEPVGSKVLSEDSQLMLSSASIRHIMSDLEACGYLYSPHTSSGRIPTTKGYRLFVNHFITVNPPSESMVNECKQQLGADCDTKTLVRQTSHLLSGITQLAGVVTMPRCSQLILKHVEFLPLSGRRILVILVFNEHEVENRVIQTDRDYSKSELERVGNYLMEQFFGRDLFCARDNLVDAIQHDQQSINDMMQTVMNIVEEFDEIDSANCVIAGESNLLGESDADYEKLRDLFEAFSHKQAVLHLLSKTLHAKGVKIYIGEESGYDAFDQCSVVTAPYTKDGQVVGVLGVIGPMRMSYHNIISAVDVTAKLLTQALT